MEPVHDFEHVAGKFAGSPVRTPLGNGIGHVGDAETPKKLLARCAW